MRSNTTAAAGSGAWMSNARIAVHTASSWKTQPEIWNRIAPAPPRQLPRQDGDARELPDPAREHRICEETDRERREDEHDARMGRFHRLPDHRPPGERAYDDRGEVQRNRESDPLPAHLGERVS